MWDLTNVKEQSFEPVPAGRYKVQAKESELLTTKAGTGEYLKLKFEIAEGEHKGRVVYHNFNVKNPSEQAQSIGQSELKTFCVASNLPADKLAKLTPAMLVGLSCFVNLKIDGDYNRISSFSVKKPTTTAATKETQTTRAAF